MEDTGQKRVRLAINSRDHFGHFNDGIFGFGQFKRAILLRRQLQEPRLADSAYWLAQKFNRLTAC